MSSSFKSLQGPYNWIDNERVQPVDSVGTFKNLEPRSGKLLAEIPSSGPKEVDRAVKSANEAFKSWSQVRTYLCSKSSIKAQFTGLHLDL